MTRIAIAGIGTEIGKTVVSAILVQAFEADYWKPVQCGNLGDSDTHCIQRWVDLPNLRCHPEAFRLYAPRSPHHAAALEGIHLKKSAIQPPQTDRPLVIEMAGGLLVPISDSEYLLDAMLDWDCLWVLVCRHYLGSINHSLLTLEAMRQRHLNLLGLVFNGDPEPYSEQAILSRAHCPMLGRVINEETIHPERIRSYAATWKEHPALSSILTSVKPSKTISSTSGTPSPRPRPLQPLDLS